MSASTEFSFPFQAIQSSASQNLCKLWFLHLSDGDLCRLGQGMQTKISFKAVSCRNGPIVALLQFRSRMFVDGPCVKPQIVVLSGDGLRPWRWSLAIENDPQRGLWATSVLFSALLLDHRTGLALQLPRHGLPLKRPLTMPWNSQSVVKVNHYFFMSWTSQLFCYHNRTSLIPTDTHLRSHPFSFQCEPGSWVGNLTGAQQWDTSNEWVRSWQKKLKYQCCYLLTGWPWDSVGTSLSFCFLPAKAMAMILPRVLMRYSTQRWSFPNFHLPVFSDSSHLPLATVTVTSLIHALTGASISGMWQLSWRLQRDSVGKQSQPSTPWSLTATCLAVKTLIISHRGKSISQTSVNEK